MPAREGQGQGLGMGVNMDPFLLCPCSTRWREQRAGKDGDDGGRKPAQGGPSLVGGLGGLGALSPAPPAPG